MKYLNSIQNKAPDIDPRSLRERVKNRDKEVLRDTYFLVDPDDSPSRRLKMGYTIIYPTGTTTGHSHENLEEVYFVISGEGTMVVGDEKFPIKAGDALYVEPGEFHTTLQKGNLPLVVLWVTGILNPEEYNK